MFYYSNNGSGLSRLGIRNGISQPKSGKKHLAIFCIFNIAENGTY